jgi:hypothetical protein
MISYSLGPIYFSFLPSSVVFLTGSAAMGASVRRSYLLSSVNEEKKEDRRSRSYKNEVSTSVQAPGLILSTHACSWCILAAPPFELGVEHDVCDGA